MRWSSAETRSSLARSQIEDREKANVIEGNEGVANEGERRGETVELCGLVPCLWILRYLSG